MTLVFEIAGRILACTVLLCGISFAEKQPKAVNLLKEHCRQLVARSPFSLAPEEEVNKAQADLALCMTLGSTVPERQDMLFFSFNLGMQMNSFESARIMADKDRKNLEAMNALLKAYTEERKTVEQLLEIQQDFAREYDSLRTKFMTHLSEDADYFTKLSRQRLESASNPKTIIIHDDPPYRSPELMHIQQVPMPVTINCTSFNVQGYTYTNCNQN